MIHIYMYYNSLQTNVTIFLHFNFSRVATYKLGFKLLDGKISVHSMQDILKINGMIFIITKGQ
jgi:hypothetical protein